jgi:hypothetical protein
MKEKNKWLACSYCLIQTFLNGFAGSPISLFVAYKLANKIHSFCIMCAASYCISFTLLLHSWRICESFSIPHFSQI